MIGGFIFLGSLGGARVGSLHVILIVLGLIFAVAGIFMIVSAVRRTKSDTAQNVTYKVDLPGDVNVEEMKCKSCGGVLTSKDISMVNGAPVVTCPFWNTVYQLTEEPKW